METPKTIRDILPSSKESFMANEAVATRIKEYSESDDPVALYLRTMSYASGLHYEVNEKAKDVELLIVFVTESICLFISQGMEYEDAFAKGKEYFSYMTTTPTDEKVKITISRAHVVIRAQVMEAISSFPIYLNSSEILKRFDVLISYIVLVACNANIE